MQRLDDRGCQQQQQLCLCPAAPLLFSLSLPASLRSDSVTVSRRSAGAGANQSDGEPIASRRKRNIHTSIKILAISRSIEIKAIFHADVDVIARTPTRPNPASFARCLSAAFPLPLRPASVTRTTTGSTGGRRTRKSTATRWRRKPGGGGKGETRSSSRRRESTGRGRRRLPLRPLYTRRRRREVVGVPAA